MSKPPYYINEAAERNDKTLAALRMLCGHVEDGSDSVVTIFQDDATNEWTIKVRSGTKEHVFSDRSMTKVIERAGRALTTVFDR